MRIANAKLMSTHASNKIDEKACLQECAVGRLRNNNNFVLIWQDSNVQVGMVNDDIDDGEPNDECVKYIYFREERCKGTTI